MAPLIYFVIPCYNEEAVLPVTAPLFSEKMRSLISSGKASSDSRILFVDDGSTDSTWAVISKLSDENIFEGVRLSRNRGHQNALIAGLAEVTGKCDAAVSLDCDGQDDVNAVDEMLDAFADGCDVVYGIRDDRKTDSFFKRTSAVGFYKFMNILGAESVENHADYRLLSARALTALGEFAETNLYLRGVVPLVGFKSAKVYYKRAERKAGKTHYSLGKMIRLALDGITGFSVRPLRIITWLGVFISFVTFCLIIYSLVRYFMGEVVTGWASTIITVAFIGGIQMISTGILGEYVGRIYTEVKRRPRYIIMDRTANKENDLSLQEERND